VNIRKPYWRILGIFVTFLIIGLALLVAVILNRQPHPIEHPPLEKNGGNPAPSAAPQGEVEVTLYFPAAGESSAGWGILQEERRRIRRTTSNNELARALLEELASGSREARLSVIPSGTRLLQVYLLKDGSAILNYTHTLAESCPEGVEGEVALVYSIVNTLTRNIPEIRRVRILIDGMERETLGGHLDISGFLEQDMSLVQGTPPMTNPVRVQPLPP
jgi:spore germination protein GerM